MLKVFFLLLTVVRELLQRPGAFDALAPTVPKGDLIVNNGTANVAMSAGADGTILVADSTSSTGYTWTNVIRGGTF